MRRSRPIGVLALGMGLAGCFGPAPESPGMSHVYNCPLDRAWSTVERTILDLHYRVVDNRHDQGGGILRAWRDDIGQLTVRAAPYLLEGTTIVAVAAPNEDRRIQDELLHRLDALLRTPRSTQPPNGVPTTDDRKVPPADSGPVSP